MVVFRTDGDGEESSLVLGGFLKLAGLLYYFASCGDISNSILMPPATLQSERRLIKMCTI